MTDDDWDAGFARSVGVFLNGATIPTTDAYGERIVDDSFLVIFNASDQHIDWCIPGAVWGRRWTIDLDTADPRRGLSRTVNKRAGDQLDVPERSMVVLRSLTPPSRHPVHRRTAEETI
jgi:isoamylase